MLNTRCAQWRTYHSKIWAIRGPLQKVTGYRYEEETACEQRTRDFKQPGPPWPTPPPPAPRPSPTIVSPLFFVSSSFLIAANRDVKTIRALLADSVPMLNSFFAYSHSFSLSLSLSCIPPLGYSHVYACLSPKTPPPTLDYILLAIEQRSFEQRLFHVRNGGGLLLDETRAYLESVCLICYSSDAYFKRDEIGFIRILSAEV